MPGNVGVAAFEAGRLVSRLCGKYVEQDYEELTMNVWVDISRATELRVSYSLNYGLRGMRDLLQSRLKTAVRAALAEEL